MLVQGLDMMEKGYRWCVWRLEMETSLKWVRGVRNVAGDDVKRVIDGVKGPRDGV
jgi:hypothetical protein